MQKTAYNCLLEKLTDEIDFWQHLFQLRISDLSIKVGVHLQN